MGLKSSKEKLLSFAISFNPEVKGVGKIPPTVYPPTPAGNLLLTPARESDAAEKNTIQDPTFKNLMLEPDRVVPYATAHIFNHDMAAIQDLLNARKLEQQLDNLILQNLYEKADLGKDAALILDTLDQISTEVSEVETLLSAIQGMVDSLEEADKSFDKEAQQQKITENYSETMDRLGVEDITHNDESAPENFLSDLSEITSLPISFLESYSSTALFVQVLQDAEWSLRTAMSPSFVIPGNARAKDGSRGFSRPWKSVKDEVGYYWRTLAVLGIGDRADYDGVFKKTALGRVPACPTFSPLKKVAYYSLVLSREYLLSAGLGSQIGTPLGQTFSASGDPTKKIFGTRSISSLYRDQAEPDSLSDYVVTDVEGNIRSKKGLKKVQVFEGTVDTERENMLSAKTAWVDTIKSEPLENKMGILDNVLDKCLERFDEAETFLTAALGKDTEKSLLTPGGLFARILKDFAKLLEGLTVETNAEMRSKNAIELMLLTESARGTHTRVKDLNRLRRRMHIFACRLANLRRISEDTEDPFVRLTSTEASTRFQRGIEELRADKNQVADALLRMSYSSNTVQGSQVTTIKRTGQQMIDAVADNVDAEGLNAMIVAIFEDIQSEALLLAKQNDDTKTYLREGGTTRYSGFDGAITLAFLFESFSVLANIFCNIGLQLDTTTGVSATIVRMDTLEDDARDAYSKLGRKNFLEREQIIKFEGTKPDSRLNKARKFLLELSAALEGKDLSNLIDSAGNVIAISGLEESQNLGEGFNITASEMIDIAQTLSREEDAPFKNFAIARSIVDSVKETTSPISVRAQALRGNTKNIPEDVAILKTLSASPLGVKFINGLSSTQLKFAQNRLDMITSAEESPYILDAIPSEVFDAIKFLLEERKNEFMHSAILFLSLPTNTLEREFVEKGLSQSSAVLNFSIDKVDEINSPIDFATIEKSFSLKYSFSKDAIVEAFAEDIPPTTLNELVGLMKFTILGEDEPLPGSEIVGQSSNPSRTSVLLKNLVESFLLKNMIKVIENLAVEEEKIQFNPLTTRSESVKDLMLAVAGSMQLDPSVPTFFFKKDGQDVKLPDTLRLNKMIQPEKLVVSGIDAWKDPVSTPVQIDTLYQLFSTKPFYVDKIKDIVLTRSIFDGVYAVMIDLDSFVLEQSTKNAPVAHYFKDSGKQMTAEDLYKFLYESKSPDRFSIESLYIGADIEAE